MERSGHLELNCYRYDNCFASSKTVAADYTSAVSTSPARHEKMAAVLDEVEVYPRERAALLVAVDRRMDEATASECVDLAIELRNSGRRIVGMDLCGDPLVSGSSMAYVLGMDSTH